MHFCVNLKRKERRKCTDVNVEYLVIIFSRKKKFLVYELCFIKVRNSTKIRSLRLSTVLWIIFAKMWLCVNIRSLLRIQWVQPLRFIMVSKLTPITCPVREHLISRFVNYYCRELGTVPKRANRGKSGFLVNEWPTISWSWRKKQLHKTKSYPYLGFVRFLIPSPFPMHSTVAMTTPAAGDYSQHELKPPLINASLSHFRNNKRCYYCASLTKGSHRSSMCIAKYVTCR